jgi:hypothetical protein
MVLYDWALAGWRTVIKGGAQQRVSQVAEGQFGGSGLGRCVHGYTSKVVGPARLNAWR